MTHEQALRLISLLEGEIRSLSNSVSHAGILFSGGLDSSIIASLCSRHMDVTLYTAGVAGAHDIAAASVSAEELGLRLVTAVAEEQDVLVSAAEVGKLLSASGRAPDALEISIYAPMFFVLGRVTEHDIFTGQGADELFGGYHRYLAMSDEERRESMKRDVEALLSSGILRDRAVSAHFGKTLHAPYLNNEVIRFASLLPHETKVSGGIRKKILRECASLLELSSSTLEKKAMQYGSGFDRILRRNS